MLCRVHPEVIHRCMDGGIYPPLVPWLGLTTQSDPVTFSIHVISGRLCGSTLMRQGAPRFNDPRLVQ